MENYRGIFITLGQMYGCEAKHLVPWINHLAIWEECTVIPVLLFLLTCPDVTCLSLSLSLYFSFSLSFCMGLSLCLLFSTLSNSFSPLYYIFSLFFYLSSSTSSFLLSFLSSAYLPLYLSLCFSIYNRTEHLRHLFSKTAVLSCHRCCLKTLVLKK